MENGKFVGDVDYEVVLEVVGYIILVLGGVGLMIIIMLLKNMVDVVKIINNVK